MASESDGRGPWSKTAVVHEVWPRSSADSDADGIGDLAGVTSRLDHLTALGVDVLRLSPIYGLASDHVDIDHGTGGWADIGPFELRDLKAVFGRWQAGLADVGSNSLYWKSHDQTLRRLARRRRRQVPDALGEAARRRPAPAPWDAVHRSG